MLKEIVKFVLEACKKTHIPLSLNFYPANAQKEKFSIFSIHLNGRSVLNFTNHNWMDLPKAKRFKEFIPLIKIGLSHNLGESTTKDMVEIPRRQGIQVIRKGVLLKPDILYGY